MATFRITYNENTQKDMEEIEADAYYNRGEYIEFLAEMKVVERLPSHDIKEVEQLAPSVEPLSPEGWQPWPPPWVSLDEDGNVQ